MTEWIVTDPSCDQQMRQLDETTFEFKELRIVNPETKETQEYSQVINLDDYTLAEMIDAVTPFGYSTSDFFLWMETNNKALIAECIFEMTTD